METISALRDVLLAVQAIGPLGVIFFIWWQANRDNQKWREQFTSNQKKWESRHMEEEKKWQQKHQDIVRMNENNVALLKTTQSLAQDSQDIVIHNIQILQKVYDTSKDKCFARFSEIIPIKKEIKG